MNHNHYHFVSRMHALPYLTPTRDFIALRRRHSTAVDTASILTCWKISSFTPLHASINYLWIPGSASNTSQKRFLSRAASHRPVKSQNEKASKRFVEGNNPRATKTHHKDSQSTDPSLTANDVDPNIPENKIDHDENDNEDSLMTICTAPSARASLHPAVRSALLREDLHRQLEVERQFRNVRTAVDTNVWHDE
jgi:hypothetical protein